MTGSWEFVNVLVIHNMFLFIKVLVWFWLRVLGINGQVLLVINFSCLFATSLSFIWIWHLLGQWFWGCPSDTCMHVVQSLSCVWLCNPMDYSTPGFPVLHYLPEFAQIQIPCVTDAIQPSHPLLPPSSPALSISSIRVFSSVSQLFASGGQTTGASASVLPMNIQMESKSLL